MRSIRTYIVALLALLLAGVSAFGLRQYEQVIALRGQLATDDSAALRKRVAELQKRLQAMADQLAALRGGRAARGGAAAGDLATGDENGPGGFSRGDFRAGFRSAMSNPEFQKLLNMQQKARLDSTYAALFKSLTQSLSLTPEQLDQFKNLLVQKQQAVMDAVQAARDQGVTPRNDPSAFGQAVTDAQSSVDQQIQSQLGASGFALYQQYEQTLPQRNTVSQVQQSLSYTQTPLTDSQSSQLIQILAQDAPQSSGDGSSNVNVRNLLSPNPTSPVTAQALIDAQGVLSQPQIQALQQVQQTQQAQAQMMQLLRASRSSGGGGGATAASGGGGG